MKLKIPIHTHRCSRCDFLVPLTALMAGTKCKKATLKQTQPANFSASEAVEWGNGSQPDV